jgi:hypothetical protein
VTALPTAPADIGAPASLLASAQERVTYWTGRAFHWARMGDRAEFDRCLIYRDEALALVATLGGGAS